MVLEIKHLSNNDPKSVKQMICERLEQTTYFETDVILCSLLLDAFWLRETDTHDPDPLNSVHEHAQVHFSIYIYIYLYVGGPLYTRAGKSRSLRRSTLKGALL